MRTRPRYSMRTALLLSAVSTIVTCTAIAWAIRTALNVG